MLKLTFFLGISLLFISCEFSNEKSYRTCDVVDNLFDDIEKHVILIIGQSNTHFGIGLDSLIDRTDKNIVQLGRFGDRNFEIIDAVEPLDHATAAENKIGFGLTFSKLYATHYMQNSDSLILIPAGFGGTGFADNHWNEGDPMYNDAVERTLFVLSKYPKSKLIGILWHQGEQDVGNENYQTMLDLFIDDIRTDLGYPNVPFILGGMVPYWVGLEEKRLRTQKIITSTIERVEFTEYADPNIPFVIQKEDNTIDIKHFNADGQREMGRRYFNSFNCSLNNKSD